MIDAEGVRTRLASAGSSEVPMETLASLFVSRCQAYPDQPAYAFVRDTLELAESITYAELYEQVCRVATAIVRHTRLGDRVLLVYHPGLDFVRAFWACVVTGRIAVPVPAPDAARFKNSAPRLLTILNDASASLLVTSNDLSEAARSLQEMQGGALQTILSTSLSALPPLDGPVELPRESLKVTPQTIAYLQYTSGSTSSPRGVMLSHRNVVAQCHSGIRALDMNRDSRVLTWLPHHHDYGLVLGVLWPLGTGIPSYLLSSLTFLRRPLRWLEAIERFGVTHTGGPNFAYAACVRAAQQQSDWRGHLGSLRSVSCGAEPIQLATLDAFAACFEAHGLPRQALMPSYGMAETVLGITTSPMNRGYHAQTLHVPSLENHEVRRVPKGSPDSRAIVACGVAFDGMEVRIVDPSTHLPLPTDAVGEIWVRGSSVGEGYWEQSEASQITFAAHLASGEGPFLRTGDLGFLEGPEVFITGRIKDLIIVRGRNLYPHDLEWTAQSTDSALRVGYGAAFSVEGDNGEDAVIVQEVERREKGKDLGEVTTRIRKAIAETHELPLRAVVLVQAGSLPRTSSGKIRRRSCRQDYLDGQLQILHADEMALVDTTDGIDASLLEDAALLRTLTDAEAQQHAMERLLLKRVAHLSRRSVADLSLDASAIECGLDSLSSFRLLQTMEALLHCVIPSSLMLAAPDLRTLAERLRGMLTDRSTQPMVALREIRAQREGLLPLSTRQQRMWFWQELAPGTALYNIPIALRMSGPLDTDLLEACLKTLIERHEILRLRWVNVDGVQRQRVEPLDDWRMQKVQLVPDDEEANRQLEMLSSQEATYAFDLLREPALRATLVSSTPQKHDLLWIFHHSVSDGWSIKVILEELAQLYTARSSGKVALEPPPVLQYLDFAEWETRWLDSGVRERELGYWKAQLHDVPICLELPTDHPRPVHQQFRGGRLDLQFTAEQHEALRVAARASDTTLYMVLLAAWQVLMHRYSGQSTVVTASVIANRSRAEFDRVVGYFANTLALRSDFDEGLTVAALLAQVKAAALGAYEHHHVPFEEVVDALDLPRDRSRMPLAQTFFVLQPREPSEYTMGNVTARRVPLGSAVAKFDLSLELQECDEGLRGWLEYDRDLFEPATVTRLVDHLHNLLAGICGDARQAVARLPMLTAAELHTQLVTWKGLTNTCANGVPVQALIEAQVLRSPDQQAVVFGEQVIDYRELNRRANRVAHQLRRWGVGPDVRVGICMERSVELVVAYLAIAKAGGAFVPLDPDLPQDRVAYMLSDTAAPVVITQPHLVNRFAAPGAGVQVLPLATDADLTTRRGDADDLNPPGINTAEDLAYVIYTSGSTGQPRGVMVSHRALSNHALWLIEKFSFGPGDRLLQKTTISFDASISDFYPLLMAGSTIVMAEPGMHRDAGYLVRTMRDSGITLVVLVPSQLESLLDEPEFSTCRSLRHVMSGGEALGLALANRFHDVLPHVRLGNFYGPSETTIDSTHFEVSGPLREGETVPIGRPIANAQCYVFDACREPVPVGVIGELYIGGAGLARGYLNRPDLTAELFVPHPFEANQRLYRTGDLARWSAHGQLEYIGRRDFQVKIRGIRIELGEIEAALKLQPGVQQAVVVVREDTLGLKRLVAYVVGAQTDLSAIKQSLKLRLPEAMVPGAFVRMTQLPTLTNGKLDRSALPVPGATASMDGARYAPPVGEVERSMATIWSELLEVDRVGRHDSFFELGGHSLLVMRMVGLLRHAGYSVSVRSVFNTPTLSALAAVAQKVLEGDAMPVAQAGRIPPGCTSIEPGMVPMATLSREELDLIAERIPGGAENIQDIYPLAPLQEGILFHHRLESHGDTYLTRALLACDDVHVQERFIASIQAVVDRHDALRTAVLWDGLSAPVQVVLRHAQLSITHVDVPRGSDAWAAIRSTTDATRVRLDLGQAPLISIYVARNAPGHGSILALLSHHIVSDHVSIAVMLEEGLDILEGRGSRLTAASPYRDFVALARQTDTETHQRYFERQLGDVNEPTVAFGVSELPADHNNIGFSSLVLDASLATQLRQFARTHGVSPAVLFHVAWAIVVARCSGTDDVVFGTVLSGRLQVSSGMERTVGLFINTLPLRIPLAGRSVLAAVDDTYRRLSELIEHEHAALSLAKRCSAIPSPLPLFNNLLNYRHGRADLHVSQTGSQMSRLPAGMRMLGAEERTNYPLSVSVDDLGDGFSLEAQAVEGIHAARVAQYLAGVLHSLVQALTHDPDTPALSLDMLSAEERRALVLDWNQTARPYLLDEPVHTLIERHASEAPKREAVVFMQQRLDYAELNDQANRLARHLRGLGVGPDVLVGICMERSLELAVGFLAVMKAGGAFLPLDPDLPRDRLAYMLEDSAAHVVLSQTSLQDTLLKEQCTGVQHWLLLDTLLADLPADNAAPPIPMADPEHLAYVIYTSGSTGAPKGVMVSHRALSNVMRWCMDTIAFDVGDRMLQKTTISFDAILLDLLLPLTAGVSVVMIRPGEQFETSSLVRTLQQERITHFFMAPSQLRVVLSDPLLEQCTQIRYIICGGEALDAELAREVARRLPAATLGNFYGPTETAIVATQCVVRLGTDHRSAVPIGRPIANSQCYVLDARRQPVPVGVRGELYIGGVGLARGYLNQPELTAERFVPHPFEPDRRAYRTGDLVRWRLDGSLEFLGRADFQVKIRGVRIELGEIESALRELPDVQQAVVLAREDTPGLKRLVAYVVGPASDMSEVQRRLQQKLSAAMVPSVIVKLDRLPTLASGKLDRTALSAPTPGVKDVGQGRHLIMPRGPVEQAMWDIWRSVLGDVPFGVFEHFFELGGHSLVATQVVARVREVLGVELPLRAIFETPTIAELSEAVEHRLHAPAGSGACIGSTPLTRVDRDRLLPTSYSQRRMWLVQQFSPQTTAYNMPFAIRLRGSLDAVVLAESLQRLMARHEAFRTTLVSVDGEPMQRIGPIEHVPVEQLDLRGLPAHERIGEAERVLTQRSLLTYDLEQGPLHRPTLIQLDEQDHVLYWSVHHAIGDGWSAGILLREIATIYRALKHGHEPELAPMAIDFADYASWQRAMFGTDFLADQLTFWKAAVQGLEPLPLPLDRPRRGASKGQGALASATFAPDTLARLTHRAAEHNATPYMLLLACFQWILGRFCGVTDIAVGTPIANRTHVSAEHLVGTLVNTVVMRTDISGELSFVDLLKRVRHTALQAYAHQDLPFEALVETLGAQRHSDAAPLVQVLFNVLTAPQPVQPIEGVIYEPFGFDTGSTQFDLALSIDTHLFGQAHLSYSTEVFEPATGERLLGAFMALVERVIADPDARLASIDLMDNESRDRLATWNDTAAETSTALTVSDLLGRQAGQSPTAIALEQPGLGSLPYAGLESRANQLARALRARGIGRGALVGLCVERGIDMVVAQLAILKSGAAYVPLDPAYPADRLAHMAEDAKLSLLVTESALVHALNWPRAESLLLDIDASEIASQSNEAMPPDAAHDARPGDPAYVIYTSGSTGKPKGVVVPHAAVVNFLVSMAREPGLTARDTLVAVTTLSFDIAVLELLLPLSVGARVVLANRAQTLDGGALRSLLEVSGATVMQATPSTWRVLIDSGWQGSPSFKALIGGEGLPADLAVQLLARTAELWNMYGPTETTVWSTCCQVTEPEHGISIGRPIANTTVHILDEHQRLCPIGVAGEIYIGGAGVTLGYLHRPELTDERFVPDPFVSGARLYRTGDRGRWRHDGMLEHLGRLDFQVKVRGHRIELGEIESQLGMLPEIARTVVIVREDVPGDVRLVAYVVAQKTLPEAQWLRDQLRRSLPDYMVPQHFIEIPAIPLLPNGKIDRRALPAPTETSHHAARDFVAPHTVTEHAVAAVWTRLLGVPRVGVTDNFFDLGGHSLLAMRAVAELNKRPGAHLTVRQLIFDNLGQIATSLPEAAASHEDIASAGSPDGVGDAPAGWLSRLMDRLR